MPGSGCEVLARGQMRQENRIVVKTIILPEGHAFGVDDIGGGIYAEQPAKTCSWCGSL
jgi:hypothetical protein